MTHLAIGVGTPPPTYIRTGQKERVCPTNTHLATCPVRITKPPFVLQLPILLFVFCLTNTHLATCPVLPVRHRQKQYKIDLLFDNRKTRLQIPTEGISDLQEFKNWLISNFTNLFLDTGKISENNYTTYIFSIGSIIVIPQPQRVTKHLLNRQKNKKNFWGCSPGLRPPEIPPPPSSSGLLYRSLFPAD